MKWYHVARLYKGVYESKVVQKSKLSVASKIFGKRYDEIKVRLATASEISQQLESDELTLRQQLSHPA